MPILWPVWMISGVHIQYFLAVISKIVLTYHFRVYLRNIECNQNIKDPEEK